MRDQHHKNICKYCLYIYIYYIYACMCMYVRMLAYMFVLSMIHAYVCTYMEGSLLYSVFRCVTMPRRRVNASFYGLRNTVTEWYKKTSFSESI